MKLTITREHFRLRWLDSINELTSYNLQQISWLDKNQDNPHWCYDEFYCTYFNDNCIDLGYKYFIDNGFVEKVEYETIKEWHIDLENYSEPKIGGDIAILNDQKWIDIVEKGSVSKEKLKEIIPSHEKKYLEKIKYP